MLESLRAAIAGQFIHDRLGPGVLPHDGVVNRLAGGLVPHHRRFALVGDADGGDVMPGQVRLGQRGADDLAGVVPDLGGVMLNPAACGKICSCSICPEDTMLPLWSKTMARVLVVPWSMAITYWLMMTSLSWCFLLRKCA